MKQYMPTQLKWLRLSLISLLVVALLGVVLRYKIAFALPFIHQKHLLHAHSHFAFSGWITQILMVLMVGYLSKVANINAFIRYKTILRSNIVLAYGMLVVFALQGYSSIAVLLSTSSIILGYWFAIVYIRDLRKYQINTLTARSFKAALLFSVISSAGAFALALMMINEVIHQNWYLLAEYFYLHFQYNGWFFFACLGLLLGMLGVNRIPNAATIFNVFMVACVPTYFLSALWLPLPTWLYILIVIATVAQLFAGLWLLINVRLSLKTNTYFSIAGKWIIGLSGIAFSLKLFLQAGSTIPALSQFAFGFRPIVIGYLHLVLLAVTSLFILGYTISNSYITVKSLTKNALVVFILGVMINELLLMSQGVAAISYSIIPYSNELLLGAALIMFVGIVLLNLSQCLKK
jgi:hypothetical protein